MIANLQNFLNFFDRVVLFAKIAENGCRPNVFRDGVRGGFYACRFAVHLSDGEINLAQKA